MVWMVLPCLVTLWEGGDVGGLGAGGTLANFGLAQVYSGARDLALLIGRRVVAVALLAARAEFEVQFGKLGVDQVVADWNQRIRLGDVGQFLDAVAEAVNHAAPEG